MAIEPICIFSQRIDARRVIAALRSVADQVSVTGPEENWMRLVATGRKKFLRSPGRLVLDHDRESYTGPQWAAHIREMRKYVSSFPDVPRKPEILRAIDGFRFLLALPNCDFDLEGQDERVAWLHAICKAVDGLIFTPSSVRDASGGILLGADGESDPLAALPSISETGAISESSGISERGQGGEASVPTVVVSSPQVSPAPIPVEGPALDDVEFLDEVDEVSGETNPPSATRVARRAMVLAAVSNRGLIEQEWKTIDRPDEVREVMLEWIEAIGVADELEPEEWKVLQRPAGKLDSQSALNAVWRVEGLGILLWALGRDAPPADDELVTPGDLFDRVALGDAEASRDFINAARLRPTAEIAALATHLLMFHWRLRQFALDGAAMDFVAFSRKSWIGEFDLSGFRIAKGDLSLGGKPISKADRQLLQACQSAAHERHLAINWLLGPSDIYSETDTST